MVPGNVDSDASVWRAEAETMALTSELAQHATDVARGSGPIEAAKMRAEADSLKARLAKYEEAAAVVMEAAEASGVTLVQHARNAAYRTERVEREERVRRVERETTGSGRGRGRSSNPHRKVIGKSPREEDDGDKHKDRVPRRRGVPRRRRTSSDPRSIRQSRRDV